MKKALRTSFLVCLVIASQFPVARAASAAEDSGFYAGAGLGRLDFDFRDASFRTSTGATVSGNALNLDVDSGSALRLSAGYNWGGWALELGYEHMLESVDIDAASGRFNNFDYSNFTVGGVYRSSGDLYFVGKFGFSMPQVDAKLPGTRLKMGNSGYVGAGFGYRLSPSWSAEFDFTQTSDDTGSFMLALRKHF